MSELTRILEAVHRGDVTAGEQLLPLVYEELRRLAAQKMAHESPGHTLQPTALVHEAWLRLGGEAPPQWRNRAHFFAAASEAMRRILVDSARRKRRPKHGGQLERVDLEAVELPLPLPADEILAVDEGLERLAVLEPRAAEVVRLCYFTGLTQAEAARELDLSLSTVERLWTFARAWLFRELKQPRAGDPRLRKDF